MVQDRITFGKTNCGNTSSDLALLGHLPLKGKALGLAFL